MRDGGSLGADFRREDGSLLSILLEVISMDAPGQKRRFRHLHAGASIQSSCTPSTIVEKGSEQEALIVSEIDAWLTGTGTVAPAGHEDAFEALRLLLRELPNREV